MLSKNKWAALVAEFLGTYVLATAVFAMFGRTTFPFFAAAAAGVTLAAMVMIIGKVSGAHLNPAVTIGLWSVKKFPTTSTIAYVAAQMVAGFTALRVNQYLLGQALDGSATQAWDPVVVIAEILGAFVLAFGIASALDNVYEGGKFAAVAGASLFLGILVASSGSNAAINPAVALGVNSFSLSYVVGPIVGTVLAFNAYSYLFATNPVRSLRPLRTAAARTKNSSTKTNAKAPLKAKAKTTKPKAKTTARKRK